MLNIFMPLFTKYNCLFLHIPKNGGTKISDYITQNSTSYEDVKFIHPDMILIQETRFMNYIKKIF